MFGQILLALFIMFALAVGTIVGIGCLIAKWWRGKLVRVVGKVNQTNGMNFVASPTTVMGTWIGRALVFDQKNRKVMLYMNGRYTLHDYSYIRRWNLHWIETPGPAGMILHKGVRMVIETSDLERPVQHFSIGSKSMGDVWMQRLNLLLNG